MLQDLKYEDGLSKRVISTAKYKKADFSFPYQLHPRGQREKNLHFKWEGQVRTRPAHLESNCSVHYTIASQANQQMNSVITIGIMQACWLRASQSFSSEPP